MLLAAAGSLVWVVILVLAARGVLKNWRTPELQLIMLLVVYGFTSVLLVDNKSARLRSCLNYAFVLFAAIGFFHWRDSRRAVVPSEDATV